MGQMDWYASAWSKGARGLWAAIFTAFVIAGCGGGGTGGAGSGSGDSTSGAAGKAYFVGTNHSLVEVDFDRHQSRLVSSAFGTPTDVALTADGSFAYVIDDDDGQISEVNVRNSSIRRLGTLSNVRGVSVSRAGLVYLVSASFNGDPGGRLISYNPVNGTATLVSDQLATASKIVLDPAGSYAYVLNTSDGGSSTGPAVEGVWRVDLATGEARLLASLSLAPYSENGLTILRDGSFLVAHSYDSPDLYKISLPGGAVTRVPINSTFPCTGSSYYSGPITLLSNGAAIVTDSVDCVMQVDLSSGTTVPRGDGSSYGSSGVFLGVFGVTAI